MKFDAMFFTRLDYLDKKTRENARNLEFLWRGSDDLGSSSDIFTSIMDNDYEHHRLLFRCRNCKDDPFIDNPESEITMWTPKCLVYRLVECVCGQICHQSHPGDHGEDFQYQNANPWYKNMDKLIKYVNANATNFNVIYSTRRVISKQFKRLILLQKLNQMTSSRIHLMNTGW